MIKFCVCAIQNKKETTTIIPAKIPLIPLLSELLVTKVLEEDTLCSRCRKRKYAFANDFVHGPCLCESAVTCTLPSVASITFVLHIFKEEDPGKTGNLQITHVCNTCEHACSYYIRACECSKICNNICARELFQFDQSCALSGCAIMSKSRRFLL